MLRKTFSQAQHGDTIIEVLIAIAVASFAIGTSYALANKSLQNAITAGDRNQALNIIQNQIADLKIRHAVYNDEDSFNADFGVPSSVDGPPYPHQARWFCLTDGIVTRNSPNWGPHDNTAISSESAASSLGNYVAACVQGDFHINVTAEITRTSELTSNHTIFKVTVRWPQFSGQAPGSAVAYYRLNKAAAATPGTPNVSPAPAPSPSPTPPPPNRCNNLSQPITLTEVLNNFHLYNVGAGSPFVYRYNLAKPLAVGCTYTFTVTTGDPKHGVVGQQRQDYEQLFIEGCSNSGGCDTSNSLTSKSPNPVFRTGETLDIPDNLKFSSPPTTFFVNSISRQVDFLLFKHCSIDFWTPNYPGICRVAGNGESIHYLQLSY